MSLNKVKRSPLFHLFSEDEVDKFLEHFQVTEYKADRKVLTEGKVIPYFFFVMEGQLVASKDNEGKELEITKLEPGNWFGEGYIFEAGESYYDVICNTDCMLLTLNFEGLQKLFSSHPHLYGIFMTNLIRQENKKLTVANKIIFRLEREYDIRLRLPLYNDDDRQVFSEDERNDFLQNIVSLHGRKKAA